MYVVSLKKPHTFIYISDKFPKSWTHKGIYFYFDLKGAFKLQQKKMFL